MSLPAVALAAGKLLTFDDRTLVAHDAASMAEVWTLAFDTKLVAVAGSVAVDAEGRVHHLDVAAGKVTSREDPCGAPVAFDARGTDIALATAQRLFVWHEGKKTETPIVATALAFGHGKLAIGQTNALALFDPVQVEITSTAKTDGRVNAVAPHVREGEWLHGTADGLFAGASRLSGGDTRAIAVDRETKRIAVARAETHVAVFRGGFDHPETRIKYDKRKVRGLALAGAKLVVALDRGDANVIDASSSEVTRTARAPERTWAPEVHGERERTELRVADERAAEVREKGLDIAQVGKGSIVIAALVFGAFLWVKQQSRDHRDAQAQPSTNAFLAETCDAACERTRLDAVVQHCSGQPCHEPAVRARSAFEAGRCDDARREIGAIRDAEAADGSVTPLERALAVATAYRGLATACEKAP